MFVFFFCLLFRCCFIAVVAAAVAAAVAVAVAGAVAGAVGVARPLNPLNPRTAYLLSFNPSFLSSSYTTIP